jgi:16S rRNA (cytidine1402-2'-O)-methyltransferase
VARELTKLHEEVLRGRASEVSDALGDVDPKGEIVLVVEGRRGEEVPGLDELVIEATRLVQGGMRKREAASAVARDRGGSANAIYEALTRPPG